MFCLHVGLRRAGRSWVEGLGWAGLAARTFFRKEITLLQERFYVSWFAVIGTLSNIIV